MQLLDYQFSMKVKLLGYLHGNYATKSMKYYDIEKINLLHQNQLTKENWKNEKEFQENNSFK